MKEIGKIDKEEWLKEMSDFPYKAGDRIRLKKVPDINEFDNFLKDEAEPIEFLIHDIDEMDITLITDKKNFIYLVFEESRRTYWRNFIDSKSEIREKKLNELGI
jgi:hypothetical protein